MVLTAVEDFADDLARAERSALTIKNYRSDLLAFATWFRDMNGEELTPAHITPTDLRAYKRFRLCRKFCSGGYEGAVAPICGGIMPRGHRTAQPTWGLFLAPQLPAALS